MFIRDLFWCWLSCNGSTLHVRKRNTSYAVLTRRWASTETVYGIRSSTQPLNDNQYQQRSLLHGKVPFTVRNSFLRRVRRFWCTFGPLEALRFGHAKIRIYIAWIRRQMSQSSRLEWSQFETGWVTGAGMRALLEGPEIDILRPCEH